MLWHGSVAFHKHAQFLIHPAELIFPVIDDVPISLNQPLFRDRCQTAHIAYTVPDGSVERDNGGRMMTERRALKSP